MDLILPSNMIISCGNCGVSLKVDPAKLHPERPLVKCPKCGGINRVRLPSPSGPAPLPAVAGWLVVHDEAAEVQTLELKPGENTVGRQSPTSNAHIQVATSDPYMSRSHATITIGMGKNGQPEYLLRDAGSANGTFLNGDRESRLSPYDEIYLSDGDVIQMGRTKLVLKTLKMASDAADARRQATSNDYQQTIIT